MTQYQWVLCPICGGKTRTKIRMDTEAKNLIVFCPKCKRESVVNIEKKIEQPCKCHLLRLIDGDRANDFGEEVIFSDNIQAQILRKTPDGKYYIEYRYKDFRKNKIVEVKNCPLCGEKFE